MMHTILNEGPSLQHPKTPSQCLTESHVSVGSLLWGEIILSPSSGASRIAVEFRWHGNIQALRVLKGENGKAQENIRVCRSSRALGPRVDQVECVPRMHPRMQWSLTFFMSLTSKGCWELQWNYRRQSRSKSQVGIKLGEEGNIYLLNHQRSPENREPSGRVLSKNQSFILGLWMWISDKGQGRSEQFKSWI